ncbi:hypothetical protein QBC47DRAFT_152536 [Echria macrotheca]|uniref:Ysc84 actin-binding domain-containing protein n=1 Tax=Echria macrotheca TaxID=438768 RepID=A0AAJ0B4P4_9PEZI|nr:hypothetical protein QBC47DRAFT_152536 [Echria macrotheca]
MNTGNDHKPPVDPTGQQQQFYPPPPPGPPPAAAQGSRPTHPDETPLPDYDIPGYDPRHPPFAPGGKNGDDIYDATPTEEHPPPFPPRPSSSGSQDGKQSWSQKLADWGTKAAAPFNTLANKMGAETFLPTSLDKECDKAARILRSFAKDGIYSDAAPQHAHAQSTLLATTGAPPTSDAPVSEKLADHKEAKETKQTKDTKAKKPRVLLTIPSKVISRAQGLAIFTTARAGFQVTGATGSGILIARLPDGSWSPPSGIQVHSVGAGFVVGLDIYDCVVVINTKEALAAFTRTRMSLGSDLAVTAGPWGAGGALDFGMPQSQKKDKGKEKASPDQSHPPASNLAPPMTEDQKQQQPQVTTGTETGTAPVVSAPPLPPRKPSPFKEVIKNPVYSYVKSRGFYAGIQIDGTVVTERKDANAAFYGAPVSVDKIIKGEVPSRGPAGMWPTGAQKLFEVLKGAEGWRGQQAQTTQPQVPDHGPFVPPPAASAAAAPVHAPSTVPNVTTGVGSLNLGGDSAGAGPSSSSAFGGGPAPPPISTTTTSAAEAKAAEAAAEAAANRQAEPYSAGPPPPSYTEPTGDAPAELPPAYVEEHEATGQHQADGPYRPYRPPGDGKTG